MKSRSPWPLYAITIASAGYFSFIWLVMLMFDINRTEGRIIFPKTIAAGLILGVIVYLGLIFVILFFDFPTETFLFLAKTALVLACSLVVISNILMVVISKRIAERSGKKFRIHDALSIVLLTIFGFFSLPIVQTRLNKLNTEPAPTVRC